MQDNKQSSASHQERGLWWKFCYSTWLPFKSLKSILILSCILGACLMALGILQLIFYLNVQEIQQEYGRSLKCLHNESAQKCQFTINIRATMKPPIVVAYFIENAYINHRRYLNSISANQLAGLTIDIEQARTFCAPFITNRQMNKTLSYTNSTLNPHDIANPCGYVAKLVFNDSYSLSSSNGTKIQIRQDNLLQNANGQFKKSSDSASTQWVDPENNHFMLWMKNSVLIKKYKLWGLIDTPLEFGSYKLTVVNNYQIGDLPITKGIYIGNPSKLGSPMYLFPVLFFLMGISCFGYAVYMKIRLYEYDALLSHNSQLAAKLKH